MRHLRTRIKGSGICHRVVGLCMVHRVMRVSDGPIRHRCTEHMSPNPTGERAEECSVADCWPVLIVSPPSPYILFRQWCLQKQFLFGAPFIIALIFEVKMGTQLSVPSHKTSRGNFACYLIHERPFPNVHPITRALMASLYRIMGLASMLPLPNGILSRLMCACPPETKWFFATLHRYNVGHRNECVPLNPCLLGTPWWGDIRLEKRGCGGNEQKSVQKGGNG